MIVQHFNHLSYQLTNKSLDVKVTIQGGHLTADFNSDEAIFSPFAIAPWWMDSCSIDSPLERVLRGCFFCLPAGLESDYEGRHYPTHGETANNTWNLLLHEQNGDSGRMMMETRIGEQITVRKEIKINSGEPVVYLKDTVSGAKGAYPVGYHPTLQLPDELHSTYIDFSPPVFASTAPTHIEDPSKGGYSLLKEDHRITDFSKVPTIDGSIVDITAAPFTRGYEDIFMLASDKNQSFSFATVTFPSQNYLYFQLKNPRVLTGTMFWTSNAGRHYAPWCGQSHGIISINEVCSNYYYGMAAAQTPGKLGDSDSRTYHFFTGSPDSFSIMMGAVPVPEGFTRVADVIPDPEGIVVIGTKGERIRIKCSLSFLDDA